jgi:Lon-like protease
VPGESKEDDDASSGVYMVDIVIRKASLLERLFPEIHGGSSLVPAQEFNPENLPARVRREQSLAEMTASQKVATAVALRELGYTVDSLGLKVSEVEVGSPADGPLEPGDVITEAEGKPVKTAEELRTVMENVDPGESVRLQIERDGEEQTVTVGTRESSDQPPRAIMGILIEPQLDFPVDISIDAGPVGGPSAGLAFALDIYDELGEDIDEGRKVVVTGALDLDGTVVPIGGIKQKTYAAHEADADVFLVPDRNAADAGKYAGDTKVVPVSSFKEALSFLTNP